MVTTTLSPAAQQNAPLCVRNAPASAGRTVTKCAGGPPVPGTKRPIERADVLEPQQERDLCVGQPRSAQERQRPLLADIVEQHAKRGPVLLEDTLQGPAAHGELLAHARQRGPAASQRPRDDPASARDRRGRSAVCFQVRGQRLGELPVFGPQRCGRERGIEYDGVRGPSRFHWTLEEPRVSPGVLYPRSAQQ